MIITRIKLSSSVRVGTNEFSFIDIKLDNCKHISIDDMDGKIIITSSNHPNELAITSMANVVYYTLEKGLAIVSRAELCPENLTGADKKEVTEKPLQDSGRQLPKASSGNKRRK